MSACGRVDGKLVKYEEEKKEVQKGKEVPAEVLQRAQEAFEDFFESELPSTKASTRDWVVTHLAPAVAMVKVKKAAVSTEEVADFLVLFKKEVPVLIETIRKMNFSRGYELSTKTYPSVESFRPVSAWLDNLQEKYSLYQDNEGFKGTFLKTFEPFLNELMRTIRTQALISRGISLKVLASKKEGLKKGDFEFEHFVTIAHIDALKTKSMQPLLELRDLLNLSRIPGSSREPSMQEQRAFEFLVTIFEEVKS